MSLGVGLAAGSPARAADWVSAPPGPVPGRSGEPLPPDAGSDALPNPVASFLAPRPGAPSSQAASTATPPTPSGLPSAAEVLSPYIPQASCDNREKPGVRAFADLIQRTYPDTGSYGILRTCLRAGGSTTEHAEGRAWDWAASVDNPTHVAEVNALTSWLLATDGAGNPYAMARRLGIMYMIWNSRIWGAYSPESGWRPYSCSGTTACHRDHVHISFGWAGAWQRTSYWTKQVASVDYGPCTPEGQRNAPIYSAFNPSRCPSVGTPPQPRNDLEFMQQNLNLAASSGDSGSVVSLVQRQLGAVATGSYGSGTVAAVGAYQRSHRLPATGWVGRLTWQAFIAAVLRGQQRRIGDYTGDGRTDLAVFRRSSGQWWVRGVATATWGRPGDVPVPGDYTGDGRTDLAVFRPSSGQWWVRGLATATWGRPGDVPVPADYTGDGRTEVAMFRPSNGVWYPRSGAATLWGRAGDVPVPADFNGDRRSEPAVFRPSTGRWYARGMPVTVWGRVGDVASAADYNGDGRTDVAVYRPSTGTWWVRGVATVRWGQPGDVSLVLPYAIARAS